MAVSHWGPIHLSLRPPCCLFALRSDTATLRLIDEVRDWRDLGRGGLRPLATGDLVYTVIDGLYLEGRATRVWTPALRNSRRTEKVTRTKRWRLLQAQRTGRGRGVTVCLSEQLWKTSIGGPMEIAAPRCKTHVIRSTRRLQNKGFSAVVQFLT